MIEIEINDKEYKVKVADTEELRETGLQNVEDLPEDEGMLFIFDEIEEVSFWMKDTEINLDIIFINEDEEVIKVVTGYAGTEDSHTCKDVKYVLELNQGSGIKKGDEVYLGDISVDEIEDEETDLAAIMQVIDGKGNSQMDLEGGERIFSRVHTKILARFAKKAFKSKLDKDYKALGKRIFKYIDYQNNKEDDFVEIKS